MSKFELSLAPDYVPHWNLQDALRELFQNALDQETTHIDNTFSYYYADNTLSIANRTSHLDTKTLLLGATSKADDNATIGKFGEGYKIAALVLTRLGKTLRIYNGDEVWTFRFSRSRKYDAIILVCDVVTSLQFWKDPDTSLIMCVDGITPAEFEQLSNYNLHVRKPLAYLSTERGRILLEPQYAGKVFVNGLYIVDTNENKAISTYRMGYDFRPEHVELDRDRKLMTDFSLMWMASMMWCFAAHTTDDPLNYKHMFKLLVSTNAPDIHYVQHHQVLQDIRDEMHQDFLAAHGQNAVPVYTQEELQTVLDVDPTARPIIVTETQSSIITQSGNYSYQRPARQSVRSRLEEWLQDNEHDLQAIAVREFKKILEDL
jgi:hypothetical protein